ncbi:hypothetical protein U1708_07850 [Sphingomonas sp. ZB1N12]|uniref:hypothetical protein n=1 Tax=Sphingomonas arabinosi TaxID=3096160 RepID=UPI002FC69D06
MKKHSTQMALLMSVTAGLSGCATLPAKEATALHLLASADTTAFDEAVQGDAAARLAQAQSFLAESNGRVVVGAGCGAESAKNCEVTYTAASGGRRILKAAAPNSKALLGSIKRYTEQMAALAEAKDLDTMKEKAEAAAGSLKALALVISPATAWAAPLINAATFIGVAQKREARRRGLLRVAQAAQPWIKVASDDLQHVWDNLRVNERDGASFRIYDLDERIKADRAEVQRLQMDNGLGTMPIVTTQRIEQLQDRQATNLSEMSKLSDRLDAMRGERLSFRKLTDAHAELILSLQNPKANTEDMIRDANSVLTLLEQIKLATKSKE